MNIYEKKALAEKIIPASKSVIQAVKPFLLGSLVPKWMWPAFGGVVAAPFLGHYLKERREKKEEAIKRMHTQFRLNEIQAMLPFDAPPLMREAENAVGAALGKRAQMDPAAGGMPGGTPGAGGPPMPPPMLAGYKPAGTYPPMPGPLPVPPARADKGLDFMRKSLREAKSRAGKKRAFKLGVDDPADREDQSLGTIVQRRKERTGYG